MIEVSREGVWEVRQYRHGEQRHLMVCPLCGYEFDKGENRVEHFHTGHEPQDLVDAAEEVGDE